LGHSQGSVQPAPGHSGVKPDALGEAGEDTGLMVGIVFFDWTFRPISRIVTASFLQGSRESVRTLYSGL